MLREFRPLLPYLKKYRWYYLLGLVALIITSGGQLLIPQFVRQVIDTLTSDASDSVYPIILRMILVAVVIALSRVGWRFGIHGASRRIEAGIRRELYNHLTILSEDFFNRNKTGDLMARATNDLRAIRMASGMALVAFVDGLFMTVAILIILISQNARLALFTIIPLPFITAIILVMGGKVRELFRTVQEGFSRMSDQAQEVLSGIRVVKTFVKEDFFTARFSETNDYYQNQNMRLVRIWGLFFPIVGFLSGLTILLLLLLGGELIITGDLSTGEFVATLSYLQMLTWPMLGAGMTVNMLQRGAASMKRINEILDTPPSITGPIDGIAPPGKPALAVRDLSFTYNGSRQDVLSGISFELPYGSTLGITGKTGSGKTTLVHLLPRLLDPPDGTVILNDRGTHRYNLDDLRSVFGMVPQNTFLFSATIRENIAFAKPDASEEEVKRVGTLAAIDRDIAEFPHGWDTVVGERGVTLSGGQKQRIALARALLADPPILILDDSLSAVDSKTEERILNALTEERRGKSTIIITNRISVIASADQILVLEAGIVTQRGPHIELISREGLYQEIYELQQLDVQKEE